MRVILVPVADRPECLLALDTAFDLAGRVSANLVGCHVRPHREEQRSSRGAKLTMLLEDGALPNVSETQARLNSENARKVFVRMAQEHGAIMARKPRRTDDVLAYWTEKVGTPERVLGILGPVADCLVVSRPHANGSGPARAFMLAALMDSGKPLLVLPQKPLASLGQRVTIAWDQGARAASAVTAALPLLARAEQVNIVCCGPENSPGPKMNQLQAYLRHWGIDSETHRERGHEETTELLGVYRDTNSDLLVMGAYSRGRLRERILGGMTHEMLFHSKLPILTLHG
ncbi:MAG: universal stress protein [Xanthomonadales bacterium]|nr:universal stress protein [Xanthomonadales bacterium]NNL95114.1 universal stress protein [Xanthomonadales bacterium]